MKPNIVLFYTQEPLLFNYNDLDPVPFFYLLEDEQQTPADLKYSPVKWPFHGYYIPINLNLQTVWSVQVVSTVGLDPP